VIAGFVSTHCVFKFLPHRVYTEPLISDELLNGLGFALYRILVPVLMTVLVAARCGAAVASDVGSRGYSRAIDAMRSMGASPERYLLTSILHAFAVATPILIGIAFLAARATSLVVFVYNHPEHGPHYWDGNFHRDLRIPGDFLYRGTPWLLAKLLVSGVGVGIIAYRMGMRPKYSGVDVSRGITSTIIAATLHVLLVHFAFAFLEF
jgi:ABC-type transporter Mla maintaining outer membrane lipid asymmetry permease subunit MlaE